MNHIGDNIRRYRGMHKWTQQYLANKLSISRTVVTRWENNESTPDLHNLIELSKLFLTSIDVLVGRSVHEQERTSTAPRPLPSYDAKTLKIYNYLQNHSSIKEGLYELALTPYEKRKHLEKIMMIVLHDILKKLNLMSDKKKPS